mgnify:CR=1 FL=1
MAKQRAERIQKEYSELVLMMDNWDEQKQYDITKYSSTLGINFRIQVPVGSIQAYPGQLSCFDDDENQEEGKGDEADESAKRIDTTVPAEKKSHFQFEILLDSQYPLSKPQVFCYKRFTKSLDMSDSLDLLSEIMHPREWSHDFSLCEIVNRLKNFIEKMIGQDERLTRSKIVGEYHLETVYDLAVFQNRRLSDGSVLPGKFAKTSWLFNCVHEEQDDRKDEDEDLDELNVIQTQRVLLIT